MKLSFKKSYIQTIHLLLLFLFFSQSFSITHKEETTDPIYSNPERGWRDILSGDRYGKLKRTAYLLNPNECWTVSNDVKNQITTDLTNARKGGYKIIPRFHYGWPGPKSADNPYRFNPSLQCMQAHIKSVSETLKLNIGLVAYVEAGMLGCWGEWHYTCAESKDGPSHQFFDWNNHDSPLNHQNIREEIINAWANNLPSTRAVLIRYPLIKMNRWNLLIPAGEAFRGSWQSRTGYYNDGFAASWDHMGTYFIPPSGDQAKSNALMTYNAKDAMYVPMEGEVSPGSSLVSIFMSCDSVKHYLKRFQFDALAANWEYRDHWKKNNCINDIDKLLGYRFVMTESSLPSDLFWWEKFKGSFKIKNVGWGKLYNQRGLEIVFKNTTTNTLTRRSIFVNMTNADPRFWSMDATTRLVTFEVPLPDGAKTGNKFEIFLGLPDADPSLKDSVKFNIRLANYNNWDNVRGLNKFGHTLTIK